MTDLLKQLCALPGVSSYEDAVRAYLQAQAAPYADSMRVDAMGNLIVHKRGVRPTGNKLMLCTHMDEVGLMVRSVTEEGYLKFVCVGDIDRRVLLGKQVHIGEAQVPGVVGLKAIHLTTAEQRKKVPKLEDYYLDIGADSREAAENLVELGDPCVFVSDGMEFGDGLLKAKALDSRAGCAVLLELLCRDLPMDVTFVFTVQEKVGARGAFGAGFSVTPEIALVVDGIDAEDTPDQDPHTQTSHLGKGPVLTWMDGGTIFDRPLFETMRSQAKSHHISWQMNHYVGGSSDAESIQRAKSGVRVARLSAPVRCLHTPGTVANLRDVEQVSQLAWLFIQAVAQENQEKESKAWT